MPESWEGDVSAKRKRREFEEPEEPED